jgi:hypothetical protein
MINELVREGIDVTVLSVAYGTTLPGILYDPSVLWHHLKMLDVAIPAHGDVTKLRSASLALKYQVSAWPRWIHRVARTAMTLHKRNPYQAIYSRSYPMVAHVAAFWLKRKLQLPWIANINDPWDIDMIPNGSASGEMLRTLSRMWMRRTFETADLVTFPSQRLLDFHSRLSKIPTRTSIVPHVGYASSETRPSSSNFTIVHAGKLGSAEITRRGVTRSLLEAYRKFVDHVLDQGGLAPTLKLVGPHDEETETLARQLGVDPYMTSTGRVDYESSLAHIASASVCLLIEGRFATGIFLPSKVADYVAAEKPVVALSPRTGVLADLADHYRGIMRVDLDEPEDIYNALVACFGAHSEGRLAELSPSAELRDHFDGRSIARRFTSLVHEAIRAAGSPRTSELPSSETRTKDSWQRGLKRRRAKTPPDYCGRSR